jgi:signal transduction histidine kinase
VDESADAERLQRLQSVTDAALSHLELDDLLRELLRRIGDILEADTVAILLLDEQRQELVARAAVGLEEEVERGVRIPVGRGFAGRVAAERRPIVLDDIEHADILNPLLREKGIESMVGVPLVVSGDVLGVLHVGALTPRDFTSDDVDLLQLAADRAAIAIEHARLYEVERQARHRLERIQIVTDAALAHLGLDELLEELLSRIRDILSADTAAVLIRDEETDELVARAAVGLEEMVERDVRIPVGTGFAGRIAAERSPLVLDEVREGDVANPVLREHGIKSMLGVPLIVDDKVLGVLHVATLQKRTFTAGDVDLLELVASRAALAIEKARVHEEIVRLDQLKLSFVAVASHELRTPATSVYGIIATLREHGHVLNEADRKELEETLWEQASRLRRLIEQLLDLSRLDAMAVDVDRQPLVLRPLLIDMANVPGFEVHVEADEGLAVIADRHVLERILSNLVANAVRHGRPPVRVTAAQSDRRLRISVEDEGDGVDPALIPRLFDRFERGSPAGEGSGLGLSIAQAYARAHGGEIVYEPSPSGGARFELVLPR